MQNLLNYTSKLVSAKLPNINCENTYLLLNSFSEKINNAFYFREETNRELEVCSQ